MPTTAALPRSVRVSFIPFLRSSLPLSLRRGTTTHDFHSVQWYQLAIARRPIARRRHSQCARMRGADARERGAHCIAHSMRPMERNAQVAESANQLAAPAAPGMLAGTRVVEIGDGNGRILWAAPRRPRRGRSKIEPPGGSPTRRIGPFYGDRPDPEGSLYFWNYNRAKRSVALDLHGAAGRESLLRLLAGADVLLDSTCGGLNDALGLGREQLARDFPSLIVARMTPFGDSGPWQRYKASDLVHLALGGVMMNCGYDPDPADRYDLPPIAPQMWHAYHIAGEQHAIAILAALLHRHRTGEGQDVSCAVHEAVSSRDRDRPDVVGDAPRDAVPADLPPLDRVAEPDAEHQPHQGRALVHHLADRRARRGEPRAVPRALPHGGRPAEAGGRQRLQGARRARLVADRRAEGAHPGGRPALRPLVSRTRTCRGTRRRRRASSGRRCASRTRTRSTSTGAPPPFAEVEHPELGRSFTYATSKWLSTETSWQVGRRAPRVGEHTQAVLSEPAPAAPAAVHRARPREAGAPRLSAPRPAVPAAGRPDHGFLVVPRLRRRHALRRGARRGMHQGGMEGQPGYPARRDGAGRRTRGARGGDGTTAGRDGSGDGRAVQQQERREARTVT